MKRYRAFLATAYPTGTSSFPLPNEKSKKTAGDASVPGGNVALRAALVSSPGAKPARSACLDVTPGAGVVVPTFVAGRNVRNRRHDTLGVAHEAVLFARHVV